MNKLLLFLSLLFLSLGIAVCQQTSAIKDQPKSDNEISNKISIHKVNDFEVVKQNSVVVVNEQEKVNKIKKTISDAEEVAGIVDVAEPYYRLETGSEMYFLWIQKDSATIMDGEDRNTVYSFSEEMSGQLYELVKTHAASSA